MKNKYELTKDQADGLRKLMEWLIEKEKDDLTDIFKNSRMKLSFILIREYYSDAERELLNEIRRQYFEDMKSN